MNNLCHNQINDNNNDCRCHHNQQQEMTTLQSSQSTISQSNTTSRNTVAALEDWMYKFIPILDHGFIRLVDYMGDDTSIVQAARVSYGKGTKKISEDRALINYLMRHSHTTPFEMCEIKLHIKLPIFVARQWIRHRTANVNEYSARYSVLDKEFYIPETNQIASQSDVNKQSKDLNSFTKFSKAELERIQSILKYDAEHCYSSYLEMLNIDENTGEKLDESKLGLARELARMNLTLNHYTQWYWKIDLHNLLHFLKLRTNERAQFEIRTYADTILHKIVAAWVPLTYEAFMNYNMKSYNVSYAGMNIIRKLINGEKVKQIDSGLSKSEWNELINAIKIDI